MSCVCNGKVKLTYMQYFIFQVNTEEPVYQSVINWVKHEEESRTDLLPQLLQHVRLPILTAKFLTDVVDEEVRKFP